MTITINGTEPLLSLETCKAYLRVMDDGEDGLILKLAAAAQDTVETLAGLHATPRRTTIKLTSAECKWPLALPVSPVRALVSVKLLPFNDDPVDLNINTFVLEDSEFMPVLHSLNRTTLQPYDRLEIELDTGYAQAPAAVEQAVLMTMTHWFETRVPVITGTIAQKVPFTVDSLIHSFKRHNA